MINANSFLPTLPRILGRMLRVGRERFQGKGVDSLSLCFMYWTRRSHCQGLSLEDRDEFPKIYKPEEPYWGNNPTLNARFTLHLCAPSVGHGRLPAVLAGQPRAAVVVAVCAEA